MRVYSYDEFFACPFTPGRFWWRKEGESMWLQWGSERGQHVLLYTHRQPNNWSAPGDVNGWDGDLDHPTLSPSIGILNDDGSSFTFHGFLEKGVLRSV